MCECVYSSGQWPGRLANWPSMWVTGLSVNLLNMFAYGSVASLSGVTPHHVKSLTSEGVRGEESLLMGK